MEKEIDHRRFFVFINASSGMGLPEKINENNAHATTDGNKQKPNLAGLAGHADACGLQCAGGTAIPTLQV